MRMNNSTIGKLAVSGWFGTALLFGVLVGGGFQDGKEKFGVVDLRKVILDSKINQEMTDRVEASRKARLAVLDFINTQQIVTVPQAERVRELELKVDKTDAEKTELTAVKDAVIAAAKEYDRLNKLPGVSLSEEDRQKLIDFSGIKKEAAKVLSAWSQDFDQQFGQIRDTAEREAIDRAQAAAIVVAKKQGYTVLYSTSSVVYAANDLTADVTKEANK